MTDPRKAALRQAALARRDALPPALREAASLAVAQRALALPILARVGVVAGYWPMRSEVDDRPLLLELARRGAALSLPVVAHPALRFLAWAPGDPVGKAGFGTLGPLEDAPEVFPDALLLPLAAFDRTGGRIGYGAGHYDRALARLAALRPVATVGLAFACQEVDAVPVEAHDWPLDAIVTEAETVLTGSAPDQGRA